MTYATAPTFLSRFDAGEISQRAAREKPRKVTGPLLAAVANSADVSAYPADAVAAAVVALEIVERALKDAGDTIDGYVSGRYTLPMWPVPSVLERTACDLARYNLYDDQMTEVVKQRYDAAITYLNDVSKGRAQLGAESISGQQPVSTAGAEVVSDGRAWGRDSARSFL